MATETFCSFHQKECITFSSAFLHSWMDRIALYISNCAGAFWISIQSIWKRLTAFQLIIWKLISTLARMIVTRSTITSGEEKTRLKKLNNEKWKSMNFNLNQHVEHWFPPLWGFPVNEIIAIIINPHYFENERWTRKKSEENWSKLKWPKPRRIP